MVYCTFAVPGIYCFQWLLHSRVFYKVKSRSAHMKSHAEQEKKAAALRQKEQEELAAAEARARKAAAAAAAAVAAAAARQSGNGMMEQTEDSSHEESSEGEDDDDEDWRWESVKQMINQWDLTLCRHRVNDRSSTRDNFHLCSLPHQLHPRCFTLTSALYQALTLQICYIFYILKYSETSWLTLPFYSLYLIEYVKVLDFLFEQ